MKASPLRWLGLLALGVLICLPALSWTTPAGAYTISGSITTDNAYVLYYGNADGTGLTQITNGSNWHAPQTFTVDVPGGSYLYVLAWNWSNPGTGNPQAWLGQFTLPGGTLYSDLNDWQYKYTTAGNPSYPGNSVPDNAALATFIATGPWNTAGPSIGDDLSLNNMSLNGAANIWTQAHGGPISGISTDEAYWIWWDTFLNSASQDGYVLFRTAEPVVVPIPPSALLLGSGLLGLGLLGFRRRRR
jgi:hypothetical protein